MADCGLAAAMRQAYGRVSRSYLCFLESCGTFDLDAAGGGTVLAFSGSLSPRWARTSLFWVVSNFRPFLAFTGRADLARRKKRADRERRLEALAVAAMTALGERDGAVKDAERRAGEALRAMSQDECQFSPPSWRFGSVTLPRDTHPELLGDLAEFHGLRFWGRRPHLTSPIIRQMGTPGASCGRAARSRSLGVRPDVEGGADALVRRLLSPFVRLRPHGAVPDKQLLTRLETQRSSRTV
jgi:hypothetical protein